MKANTAVSNRHDLLTLAIRASLQAGEAILEVYDSDFEVRFKQDRSPLTEADRRAHRILARCLTGSAPGQSSAPELPILSEEGSGIPYEDRKSWSFYWLIDPLDGTKEFIKRNPEFTVNVALIHDTRPVLGVVYLPASGELFFGADGCGAFRLEDGRHLCSAQVSGAGATQLLSQVFADALPLHTPHQVPEISSLRIMHSRSHSSCEEEGFLTRVRARFGQIDTVPAGSSLKFCRVAQGSGDVYPRFGPTMEWDTAAGQCVVEQAGGETLEIDTGGALRYNKPELRNPPFIVLGAQLKAVPAQRDAVLGALRP